MSERRYLGVIEVDTGTLLIGDPGYTLPYAKGGRAGIDYDGVIDADPIPVAAPLGGQPVLLLQHFGRDGAFGVFGEFEDNELIRVVIDFEPLDAVEDEE